MLKSDAEIQMNHPNKHPQGLYTELSPTTFVQLTTPPRLIDVRSGLEFALFHAPKASNLSLHRILMGSLPILKSWALPEWFRVLPKDEPIAVVCLTSHRSPIAAQQLVKMGFSQVYNISGGMMAWRRSHLPLAKTHP